MARGTFSFVSIGLALLGVAWTGAQTPRPAAAAKGVLLADLTWVEAKSKLTPETVVVIPLGAESK
jgi:hypothetical protein